MFIFGGGWGSRRVLRNGVWELDVSTMKWRQRHTTGSVLQARDNARIAVADGALWIFGGVAGTLMEKRSDMLQAAGDH